MEGLEATPLKWEEIREVFTCRICGVSGLFRWVSEQPNDVDVCIVCHEEGINE